MTDNLHSLKQRTFLSPWLDDVSQAQMESLGSQGGFSGAVIWKVSLENKFFCLRRWPQGHPTMDGLSAIHGLLQHVKKSGFKLVPVPLPTRDGDTFFLNEEHLWELAPWMPGEASYKSQASRSKLEAAAHCLASFHQAAAQYAYADSGRREAVSPGLQQRLDLLLELQRGGLDQLWLATRSAAPHPLRELALTLLEGILNNLNAVTLRLQQMVDQPLPLQWCLRDVRHDHILYTGDQVTGLIDFGAVAVDSVVGDLARMLGSMVNDDVDSWQAGIDTYSRFQPLSKSQRQAIIGFDEGGTLCSAANWVRWLFVDQRVFSQTNALKDQLHWLSTRLKALESRSGASIACGW